MLPPFAEFDVKDEYRRHASTPAIRVLLTAVSQDLGSVLELSQVDRDGDSLSP